MTIKISKNIEKYSSLIIRKSDGENFVVIGYKNINGIRLIKYLKIIKTFQYKLFKIFLFKKFSAKELINSFHDADYIGVPIKYFYYGYTSSVKNLSPK